MRGGGEGAVGGIDCGNLSLPSKKQPIVPGVGRCASLSSLPQLYGDFSSYHLFLLAQAGSWRVSQVSCSQPWLRGTKQQVLKSHSPQERLPFSLTWITNVFPQKLHWNIIAAWETAIS